MIDTVDYALHSEPEAAQSKWMEARNVGEKVTAIVGTEMRGVSPDALGEVATSLKLLVRQAEKALRIVNKAGESWPIDRRRARGEQHAHNNPHSPHPHTCINRCTSSSDRRRQSAHTEDHGTVEGRKRAPPVQ